MALNLEPGQTFVAGLSQEKAAELLALADEKGIDQRLVVASTAGGFIVPSELVEDETPKTTEKAKPKVEETKDVAEPEKAEDEGKPEAEVTEKKPPVRRTRAKKPTDKES